MKKQHFSRTTKENQCFFNDLDVCVWVIGGWGGESFVTPNREIVSFRSCVRACERARDQHDDCAARAVVRPV